MPRILIVEDEEAMLIGLRDNLEFEGYEVDTANRGDDGFKKLQSGSYDLVLLDVMLPGMSGFDVCKKTRAEDNDTPIILLTARGEELDKVLGLELGADDYVTKPFSLRELLARIKVILRRTANVKQDDSPQRVTIGQLQVSFDDFEALHNDEPVKMSYKEFEILHYLYRHAGRIVSRDDILDQVWGMDYQPTARTVDNFIVRLRNKIDTEDSQHIVTVHGIGYKLVL
ncbi:response regulator transcription factor [Prolixibacter denitrificans]|uniref:DNA-binding response regulator n=1 Tax=Prolixibacter denitrificans TaxID=1541063 RepID=A0A2P8C5Y2_9BACT|nr:response regulator transcription factor [Prolixibacter denitrificans]PSK80374.1 two-component system alkaline phosphatase synthesis response regulator PhoP [Prolixibacter denitrificans]GET23082.1 DNA-binding response regulator [Prolixibacter denitrificans]